MVESAVPLHQTVQGAFPGVPERRVPEVVRERDGLREVLVQPEAPGDRPRDARHLDRVGETVPQMVAGRAQEDLRLVFEPPERLAVQDAVAVALELGPVRMGRFGVTAPAKRSGVNGVRREGFILKTA